jgi:hypothetical protein
MARRRANLTDLLNNLTFKTLYEKYQLIAVNAFEWDGLPDGILERHVEAQLFSHGKAIFYRSADKGFMCLRCDDSGQVNVYNDPLGYIASGVGYTERVPAEDCVIIENNKLRIPTDPFIMFYVNKLVEAERTMDVNIKACKTPVVFACDDKDVLTFKRIFQQVDGNTPAIYADRGLNMDSIQAFQTGVKFMGKDLQDYANSVENKLLTFLGLNNTPVDKKERLITDEAQANNQLIASFADLQMEARKRAAEAINEKYGLNVSVKRREAAVENPVEEVENHV